MIYKVTFKRFDLIPIPPSFSSKQRLRKPRQMQSYITTALKAKTSYLLHLKNDIRQ